MRGVRSEGQHELAGRPAVPGRQADGLVTHHRSVRRNLVPRPFLLLGSRRNNGFKERVNRFGNFILYYTMAFTPAQPVHIILRKRFYPERPTFSTSHMVMVTGLPSPLTPGTCLQFYSA